MDYKGIKFGKNLDFQQLIRILIECLGSIQLGIVGSAHISLNH
jgi:hypothetical protein